MPIVLPLRVWRLAFWVCLVVVLTMSLVPAPPEALTTGWDKTNHLLGFAVLAVLGCCSYPGRTLPVLATLLAYGALIEGLQALTPTRSAEWGDWLADGLGLLAGWLLVRAWALLRR